MRLSHKHLIALAMLFTIGLAFAPADATQSRKKAKKDNQKPDQADQVCPLYIWMEWGSYNSYYSLLHPSCTPANYDGNVNLATSCGVGCISLPKDRKDGKSVPDTGYPGEDPVLRNKKVVGFPGTSDKVNAQRVDRYLIKFKHKGKSIFAQVFIATVKPKKPDPERPIAIVARGLQIKHVDGAIRYDLTKPKLKKLIKPTPGRKRSYTFTIGQLSIPIILHNKESEN